MFPPKRARGLYSLWSLTPHPFDQQVPSKSGEFDDTVLVGNANPERNFVARLLALVHRPAASLLFHGLALHRYEKLVRSTSEQLGFDWLRLSPHMFRHGGPSRDALVGTMTLQQIQQRGRWKALESVRRYEKHAKLLRVAGRLSADDLRDSALVPATLYEVCKHSLARKSC